MSDPVSVTLQQPADYEEWRVAARRLLSDGIDPKMVGFRHAGGSLDLFEGLAATGTDTARQPRRPTEMTGASDESSRARPIAPDRTARIRPNGRRASVPREFPALARRVICHRDEGRYALLYQLLWRLQHEPQLLDHRSDDDVWRARRMAKAVRRDAHKMKAFVRFRRIEGDQGEAYIAWFEPQHHIVELTAPFFARRFSGMRWSIVTPDRSAHWSGSDLQFTAGASRRDCPDTDALEAYWRVYYSSIFNPARLKLNAMRAEMPVKYWRNLPESQLIPELVRSARRTRRAAPAGIAPSIDSALRLVAAQPDMQAAPIESPQTLDALSNALRTCRRCDLCHHATAAVPGEGPADARIMIVGEQPGDREDLTGRPFVGPAGGVLDDALAEAGIERESVYLTNAVKHFKHTLRGKRRIHQRPNQSEIEHCRWWLNLERQIVAPKVTIALGATAARALLDRRVRLSDVRGRPLTDQHGKTVFVTVHPAYLLRIPDREQARTERQRFVAELRAATGFRALTA